ncbi:MAG: sigma-70 family RNA polymerase sigma factor [candidate division WOR-3 bacterium]|jgi:RNA polymerase sigma-70 factor (ECF subfamily)
MTDTSSLFLRRDICQNELDELVKQAKHDEGDAVSRLCTYTYAHVYAFLYYRVPRPEDAEDLTSEVVLKIIKALKKQRGNFHAWMYRIARNRLIDFYRQRAVRAEVSMREVAPKELSKDDGFSKHIMTKEKLRKGLDQLTDEQRQVIILKFIEGYANREVAEIVGKSVGAVKVLQFRALRSLREYFARRGYEAKD